MVVLELLVLRILLLLVVLELLSLRLLLPHHLLLLLVRSQDTSRRQSTTVRARGISTGGASPHHTACGLERQVPPVLPWSVSAKLVINLL